MRLYDPELAKILEKLDKKPILPTLRTFADIAKTLRETHEFLIYRKDEFEKLYTEKVNSGKFSKSGLNDMRADFDDAFNGYRDTIADAVRREIESWKDIEQRDAFAVVNKAPTDDQARQLETILKRDSISKSELEMWAKSFGANYLCASAFRDFAKRNGYLIVYSDFTDADERLENINKAYEYLNTMLSGIDKPSSDSYQSLAFYGTDENGEYYKGTLADVYTESLDRDPTFKHQKIDIKEINTPGSPTN